MGLEDLYINLGFDSAQYKAEDRQILQFSLINDSNETMYVLKWDTPFDGFNNDMFRVTKDGTQAVYMGRIVKRGPPQPDDYITIPPKDSVSVNVDLSEAYDINEAGSYSVEFKAPILDAGTVKPDVRAREMAISPELTPIRVSSNVASFELLESRSPRQLNGIAMDMVAKVQAAAVGRLAPNFNNCPIDRQNELNDALAEAIRIALESKTALMDTLEDQRPSAIRCSTWFGIYDKQRYDKITDNFDKIWDALENRGITFYCDCDENIYAYVYPTRPYEIFLCKLFWRAPLTGTDSRSGTIVHEVSHFNVVAGTDDYVYGHPNCQRLAIENPSDAIANADTHEYFAENNPPLTMGTNAEPSA
jgi:peptidyl-Lys metalloendopeptidase